MQSPGVAAVFVSTSTGATVTLVSNQNDLFLNTPHADIGVFVRFLRLNLPGASPPALDGAYATVPPCGCFLRLHTRNDTVMVMPTVLQSLRTDAAFIPFDVKYVSDAVSSAFAVNTVQSTFPDSGLFIGTLRSRLIPRELAISLSDAAGAPLSCLSAAVRIEFHAVAPERAFINAGECY